MGLRWTDFWGKLFDDQLSFLAAKPTHNRASLRAERVLDHYLDNQKPDDASLWQVPFSLCCVLSIRHGWLKNLRR